MVEVNRLTSVIWKIQSFVGRWSFISAIIAVVLITLGDKAITGRVMFEIAGLGALSIAIANFAVYTFTQEDFYATNELGKFIVIAAIILGSFLFVGLSVVGIYYAKVDGADAVHGAVQPGAPRAGVTHYPDTNWYKGNGK